MPDRPFRPSVPEWIYLGTGLLLTFRYRWVFDDAFVYFRYVDNLLFQRIGLVFNAGEFVEGFSSPLHCLVLVALRSTGLGYPVIIIALGLAAFAAFWALLVRVNDGLRSDPRRTIALNFPLAFLASNYAVLSFFTSGLETPLVHVAAAATALFILRPASRPLAIAVAISPLARPEMTLTAGLAVVWAAWRTGRVPWTLVGAFALFNGAWVLFRIWYYADVLPNTFYLKDGTNWDAGWRYLHDVTGTYHVLPVFVLFAVLAGLAARRARRPGRSALADLSPAPRIAMLLASASITAYVVRSGGSPMHYYYLAAPLVLATCALGGILESAVEGLAIARGAPVRVAAMVVVTGVVFSAYPRTLSEHPVSRAEEMTTEPTDRVMTDPSYFRHPERVPLDYERWPSIEDLRAAGERVRSQGYETWTSNGWCGFLYAHCDQRAVHPFGLTDGFLARVEMPEYKRGHKPGLALMAIEIVILEKALKGAGPGMFRLAAESGRFGDWVADNLETLEVIERKVFNEHDLAENLPLAFTFPPKIEPGTLRMPRSVK